MIRQNLERRKTVRGLLLVGASAAAWSTGGLIVRSLDSADSWTTVFWRSLCACLFLFCFLVVQSGPKALAQFRQMGLAGFFVGFFLASASISLVVALNLTTVANTLMIMSSTPLIAAVLGRVFLGEPIRTITYLTIAAVMCGIALMASESLGRGSIAGDFVALLIAFSYAAAIVTMRRYHEIRMAPAACWGAAIATVASLPLAIPLSVSAHDLPLLIFFGVGQLGLGMALFVTGVGLIPAAHSALIGMIEPVLGTIWVWLAFGERPASTALIGGAIVMVSIAGNTLVRLR